MLLTVGGGLLSKMVKNRHTQRQSGQSQRHNLTAAGAPYSPTVGLIYVFNLIVGTGALTMPSAFRSAGWAISIGVLITLAAMSYLTASFVIETMACANAVLRLSRHKQDETPTAEWPSISDSTGGFTPQAEIQQNECSDDNTVARRLDEHTPLLTQENSTSTDLMDITERIEMGQMVSMFFNKVGVNLFYIAMVLYLYGDLAIYAAAVPKSLRDVVCTFENTTYENTTSDDNEPCWGSLTSVSRRNAYRIFLAAFALLLGPFVFFDVQKMKIMQILTTILRWVGFLTMIILAIRLLSCEDGRFRPAVATPLGIPRLFGVCVYAFMCHHSLPSLLTPVVPKTHLRTFLAADYTLIAAFYLLLSLTGIFAFQRPHDLYTLDFRSPTVAPVVIGDALALFPVLALGANFPIIAITLRNNLRTLFCRGSDTFVGHILLPFVTLVPPLCTAMATDDVGILVGVTGSYAGAAVQYVIPAFLVRLARASLKAALIAQTDGAPITHMAKTAPFQHIAWVVCVLVWAVLCIALVTIDHIITRT